MNEKLKFSMVLETDISYGGGTEKTLLFFNKYLNKDEFLVNIFDTNIIDKKRLSEEELIKIYNLEKTKKIIFPQILKNLLYDPKKGISTQKKSISKDLFLFYSIILKFFSFLIFNRKKRIELFKSDAIYILSDYQIFYLVFPWKLILKKFPKIIFGTHNYLPIERRYINKIENKMIERFTDAIHYTSPAIYNLSKIHREKDFIVQSGVETEKFYPEDHKGNIKFLFVGRLVEYKGLKELINSWELFKEKDVAELHIVGSGDLENFVRESASKIKNIIYHGFVPEEELPSIYRQCDIFVFPTYGIRHDEYFGLVVIEALASGNYVLVGEGMRGIFDYFEKEGALEYIQYDPEKICDRMEFAFKNIDSLKSNVLKNLNYIKENYDWKNISIKFGEKIKNIIKN